MDISTIDSLMKIAADRRSADNADSSTAPTAPTTPTTPTTGSANAAPLALIPAREAEERIERLFDVARETLNEEERKKVERRIEKLEKRRGNTTSGIDENRARVRENALRFVLATWGGKTANAAAAACGIDLSESWGDIHGEIATDPRLFTVFKCATSSARARLVQKAVSAVEQTLDGVELGKSAARTASFVLDRSSFFGGSESGNGRTAPTAAPQVVINLGREYQIPRGAASVFSAGQGVIQG